jgi:hypothetical protein
LLHPTCRVSSPAPTLALLASHFPLRPSRLCGEPSALQSRQASESNAHREIAADLSRIVGQTDIPPACHVGPALRAEFSAQKSFQSPLAPVSRSACRGGNGGIEQLLNGEQWTRTTGTKCPIGLASRARASRVYSPIS